MAKNIKNNDMSLKDVLDYLKNDIFLSLNCHAIATIQSFNSATQTVTATMNYTKSFVKTSENGEIGLESVQYPLIIDCPIYVLGDGADCAITFPIKVGAECSILFNDRDIDNWYATGVKSQPPDTQRLHSFSDGIALIGVRNSQNVISDYDDDRAVLRNGTTRVAVTDNGLLELSNEVTTLKSVIKELSDIVQLLANDITPTTGLSNANLLIITARITAYNVLLGELLE